MRYLRAGAVREPSAAVARPPDRYRSARASAGEDGRPDLGEGLLDRAVGQAAVERVGRDLERRERRAGLADDLRQVALQRRRVVELVRVPEAGRARHLRKAQALAAWDGLAAGRAVDAVLQHEVVEIR